jgi:thioredoxin reductase (NADPH)
MTKTTKALILGSGPAGCTAAIYAARAGMQPIMLEGLQPGGQLMITNEVENYPPFASTTGPGLMAEMRTHCEAAGVDIQSRLADAISYNVETATFDVTLDNGEIIVANTVILATGAKARWLGLPSEEAFMGRGISACATCDGFFYRGKEVLVVGGGNTAVEEALYLSNLASKVTLIHRRDTLRAEQVMQDRLFAKENIDVIWNAEVEEILGDDMGVTGAKLATADGSVDIDAHGVFIAIGHSPETTLVQDLVDRDVSGYVIVKPGTTVTSHQGIFAAGDVADPVYRQAITSAGMGCQAALDAERYLAGI